MKIVVLYFAQVREACGLSRETVDVPAGSRIEEAWEAVAKSHPALASLRSCLLPSRNARYTSWGQQLTDGDEISFLAPTGGG